MYFGSLFSRTKKYSSCNNYAIEASCIFLRQVQLVRLSQSVGIIQKCAVQLLILLQVSGITSQQVLGPKSRTNSSSY